jgi:hypothetical protein
MPSTKRLNGLPNSIGQSYLSTLKYYHKGYMADWLSSVALQTKQFEIEIDIFSDIVTPNNCQIKALIAWNCEFRELIKKVLTKEGFEENFITEAKMKFQIRSRKGQNNIIKCEVLLKDKNGKLYSNKNPIEEQAYENPFNPFGLLNRQKKTNMNYKYSICHIDKSEIEYKNETIDKEQILDIVINYPWSEELKRMQEIDESKICYSPSLDFKNIDDNHSFCLTAEGEPLNYSFSVWYNRPIKKKVMFGLMGEKEKLEVIDKHFEKVKAIELLKRFLAKEYKSIEQEMK